MQTSRMTFNLASVAVRTLLFGNQGRNTGRRNTGIKYNDSGNPFSFAVKSECFSMNPSALLLLSPGAEELESISVVDVLRRGNVQVTIGGVCGMEPVKCRSETVICPDLSLKDAIAKGPYTVIVLPGGIEGARVLSESSEVGKLLKAQECNDGLIAAICAGPTALKAHNIGKGKCLTSFPSKAAEMKQGDVYQYKDDVPVVVDGKLITSRGPATAMIFALTILEKLQGFEKTKQVAEALLYQY